MKPKLSIELVPRSCWYTNVRSEVSKKDWDKIKLLARKLSGGSCEICGGSGKKWPVECHEIWDYDDTNHIQRLTGIIALCPKCHQVKHIGRSLSVGNDYVIEHLATINNWTIDYAKTYINSQISLWEERSKFEWALDVEYLKTYLNMV